MAKQVTLRKVMKADPVFVKWMRREPTLRGEPGPMPWRVWVQREKRGRWAYKDFATYREAFSFLAKHLKKWHDCALGCKARPFVPPQVVDGPRKRTRLPGSTTMLELYEDHDWCPFCRRPTRFGYFTKHHAMPKGLCTPYERRCSICGVRFSYAYKAGSWQ